MRPDTEKYLSEIGRQNPAKAMRLRSEYQVAQERRDKTAEEASKAHHAHNRACADVSDVAKKIKEAHDETVGKHIVSIDAEIAEARKRIEETQDKIATLSQRRADLLRG